MHGGIVRNRLLLYVHFNKNNELSEHVIYQLSQIRQSFDNIVFISNSVLQEENLQKLKRDQLIDDMIQRENSGYDFAAWSQAMKQIGFKNLGEYDSVTIMNDTCFGPFYDFETYFKSFDMNESNDFWGITNNRSHSVAPWGEKIQIPEHIQSYFVSFKPNIVRSEACVDFWDNIEILSDVVKVIVEYETGMTARFVAAGFKYDVIFDTLKESWAGMPIHDFSVFNLPELLKRKVPFLKVKSFVFGEDDIYTPLVVQELERTSIYPIQLIVDHMTLAHLPDSEYMLAYKTRKFDDEVETTSRLTLAIHLHVYYVSLLEEYVENFQKYLPEFSLYITTDTESKAIDIKKRLGNTEAIITVTGNKGRDVLPWMLISEQLNKFDIVGHFHTKRSELNQWIVGESWRHDLVDSLIKPAKSILKELENNPKLGIIIPDVPSFFDYHHGPSASNEAELYPKMQSLWTRLSNQSNVMIPERDTYVMSYGTMIFYRPNALESLLSLDILAEVPAEPLPFDSVLHAFERLLVYVSWANGFDYLISSTHDITGFTVGKASNRMLLDPAVTVGDKVKWEDLGAKRAIKYVIAKSLDKIGLWQIYRKLSGKHN